MPDNKINTVLTAQDMASAKVKGLRNNIKMLGSKTGGPLGGAISGIAGVGVAAGGAGIAVGLLADAGRRAMEMLSQGVASALAEEKSLKRLDTALEANIENWNGNRAAIDKNIDARMALGFEDDALRDSMVKLVAATRDVDKALFLQRLSMDVARGREMDLAGATDLVIKANMGNVGALRRVGIEVDKNATKQEILNQLLATYSGQAEAFAQTTVGKLTVANTKVSELQEKVGATLLPLMGDVANNISESIDNVERFFAGEVWKDLGGEKGLGALPRAVEEVDRELTAGLGGIGRAGFDLFVRNARKAGGEAARELTVNFTDELQGNKDFVKDTMKDLMFAINHPLKMQKEIARIEGALTGDAMASALASSTPWVVAQAEFAREQLIDQWEKLTGQTYSEFVNVADAAERGLRTFNPPAWFSKFAAGEFNRHTNREYGQRAAGGPVAAGGTYLVGERGPELLHMGNSSGRVTPNHQLGGDVVVNIDGRELFRIVDGRMGKRLAMSSSNAYVRG